MTHLKKWNSKMLLLRIIAFPLFLSFNIFWMLLIGVVSSLIWLKNGGQMVFYSHDHGKSIVTIIEQNKKLLKTLNGTDETN